MIRDMRVVNGYPHFESQKKHIRQYQMNICGSWWYINNIITCNPEPQANGPEWCLVHVRIILRASRTRSPNQTEVSETVLQGTKLKIIILYLLTLHTLDPKHHFIIGCCNNILVWLYKETIELNQFIKTNVLKN